MIRLKLCLLSGIMCLGTRRQMVLNIPSFSSFKIKKMKLDKSFYFLKPRLLNIFFTILVLCLPILREQYNNGQYVTYHKPIVVIINYFQHFQQPHLLLVMAIFILIVYFVMSLVVLGGIETYTQNH